jgi:hypothetical protein
MVNLNAYFGERQEGERRMWKAPTDIALDQQLEQFVRETAQNSADEGVDSKTPELVYRFIQLRDGKLDDFLDGIEWDRLKHHLSAVAEDDDEIGVQKMLDRVDDGEGVLPLLLVEDRHTSGLTGDEFSEGTRYSSLVQDFGHSTKEEDQGGVHGVGASVLWGFSGFKTAFFHTTPVKWDDDDIPRLVGRIDLPYHKCRGQEWHGDGWVGASGPSGRRSVSIKGKDAEDTAADTLHFDEERSRAKVTGTTAVVVGFREPNRSRRSPSGVIDRIGTLAARYYWPLLLESGLDVSVQSPGDGTPDSIDPRSIEELTPFIEAYDERNTADASLDDAPAIAAVDVPFEVPPPADGGSPTEGNVTLVVRTSDGKHTKHKNHVALFRGARHVVKYRKYGHVARAVGQEFHGLLLAGRARHPSDADDDDIPDSDKVIEDFLRSAEPRAHNTWEAEISKLQNNYPDGHGAIEGLIKDDIPQQLTELLTEAGPDGEDMLESVGSQFPYFSGGPSRGRDRGGGGGGSRTVRRSNTEATHVGGRYQVKGELELVETPTEAWTFGVSKIEIVDGSHRPIVEVDVDTLDGIAVGTSTSLGTSSTDPTTVTVPAGEDEIQFELTSTSTTDIAEVGEGQVRLNYAIEIGGGGGSS